MKCIFQTIPRMDTFTAKVYSQNEYGEFVVKPWMNGWPLRESTYYYTPDREDAINTAFFMQLQHGYMGKYQANTKQD